MDNGMKMKFIKKSLNEKFQNN